MKKIKGRGQQEKQQENKSWAFWRLGWRWSQVAGMRYAMRCDAQDERKRVGENKGRTTKKRNNKENKKRFVRFDLLFWLGVFTASTQYGSLSVSYPHIFPCTHHHPFCARVRPNEHSFSLML
jgi:hypothetical protein